MRLLSRTSPAAELAVPLARLSPRDYLRTQDLGSHVLVTGASGSGKTTGAAELLAATCLRIGMGMLICCLKPDEADLWVRRCAKHGRLGSLIRWDGRNHRFNFITHILARFGVSGLNSVVEYLLTIVDLAKRAAPSPGRESDQFWTDSIRTLLRHAVPLIYAATGGVRVVDVINFVRSAPQTPEQFTDSRWQASSFFCRICMMASGKEAAVKIDNALGMQCLLYWKDTFATLDPKTRSNIAISLVAALDRLCHGWLRDCFCTDSTITPELCFHGAVIVMDMPSTTLGEDGLLAQLIFKHAWQQAMLARTALEPSQRERYCCLFADEAPAFVTPGDADFLAACRSSKVCVVYLAQSLPSFYAKIGGSHPEHVTHHLLTNFNTKIFHANSCKITNSWASETIGRRLHRRASYSESEGTSRNYGLGMNEGENWGGSTQSGGSSSTGPNGAHSSGSNWGSGASWGGSDGRSRNLGSSTNYGTNSGWSEQADWIIEPGAFAWGLRTGGPANGGIITAVWYQTGRIFGLTGGNHVIVRFRQ